MNSDAAVWGDNNAAAETAMKPPSSSPSCKNNVWCFQHDFDSYSTWKISAHKPTSNIRRRNKRFFSKVWVLRASSSSPIDMYVCLTSSVCFYMVLFVALRERKKVKFG